MTATTISDTERREVAARLRKFASDYGSDGVRAMNRADANYRIFNAIGFDYLDRANWVYLGDQSPDLTPAYAKRLADLIDPSDPKVRCVAEVKVDGKRLKKLAHDAVVEATGIDRDALLALADEILENADLNRELHDEMLNEKRLDMTLTFHEYACELREYAIRIREALGVDDG